MTQPDTRISNETDIIVGRENFKCGVCGHSGEKWFSWDGQCLACEDAYPGEFEDDCDIGDRE